GSKQPFVTFFARVKLQNVIDLTSLAVRKALKLTDRDLHADWRKAARPTKTQPLGLAIATKHGTAHPPSYVLRFTFYPLFASTFALCCICLNLGLDRSVKRRTFYQLFQVSMANIDAQDHRPRLEDRFLTRRDFLCRCGLGFGMLSLANLLAPRELCAALAKDP